MQGDGTKMRYYKAIRTQAAERDLNKVENKAFGCDNLTKFSQVACANLVALGNGRFLEFKTTNYV